MIKAIIQTIDVAIEAVLFFLIIFTPLAFGTVHIWAYTGLELSISLLFFMWILKIFLLS